MDKKIIILGIGIIGALAYFLTRSNGTSETPGAIGGNGGSKKEETGTEVVTETTTPITQPIIYNITFPENVFPSLPDPGLETPWWIKSDEPQVEISSKKEKKSVPLTAPYKPSQQTISETKPSYKAPLRGIPGTGIYDILQKSKKMYGG